MYTIRNLKSTKKHTKHRRLVNLITEDKKQKKKASVYRGSPGNTKQNLSRKKKRSPSKLSRKKIITVFTGGTEGSQLKIVKKPGEFPEFKFLQDYRFVLEHNCLKDGKRRFLDSIIYPNCFSFDLKKIYFTARGLYYLKKPEVMVDKDKESFLVICDIINKYYEKELKEGIMPKDSTLTRIRNINTVRDNIVKYYEKKIDLICLPVSKCMGEIITNTEDTIHILIQKIDSFISARGGGNILVCFLTHYFHNKFPTKKIIISLLGVDGTEKAYSKMGFRKVTVEDKQQYRIAYKENMIIDDTALILSKCIENCNGKLRDNTFFYFVKGAIAATAPVAAVVAAAHATDAVVAAHAADSVGTPGRGGRGRGAGAGAGRGAAAPVEPPKLPPEPIYQNPRTPEELRFLYSIEGDKFPKWVSNIYNESYWLTICNKIKEPIPVTLTEEERTQYHNLLLNRQTCNIGMEVRDKRDLYKSEYEIKWLYDLGLSKEEIINWPNMPVKTEKKFGDGKLPMNIMVMNYTPMIQKRWEKKKLVNIINLIGYGFDSYLQPDFQRYYFWNLKVEDGRKIIKSLKDTQDTYNILKKDFKEWDGINQDYKNLIISKEGNLDWFITSKTSHTENLGIYQRGTFGYELIFLYHNMFKKACDLAIVNGMEAIFFTGVGASAFGPLGVEEWEFDKKIRDIVFKNLITSLEEKIDGGNYFFMGKYKDLLVFDKFRVDRHDNKLNENPEPNYYIKGHNDKLTLDDNLIKTLQTKTDIEYTGVIDEIKNLQGNKICYINAWDPHSIAGNGNENDNSLDGYIGANSAVSLLSWPPSNPVLAEKVGYIKSNLNRQPLKGILKKTQKVNLPKVIPNIEDFRVGTSKKNDYYKPKSDSLYEKTKSYLNQCNRIKKAYKEKHREIQRIFNYVKKLYESKPDIPIKDANINEIIQYLENNIKIEDIEKKHIELKKKRREQNVWKEENEKIYKELMKRLKKMKQ